MELKLLASKLLRQLTLDNYIRRRTAHNESHTDRLFRVAIFQTDKNIFIGCHSGETRDTKIQVCFATLSHSGCFRINKTHGTGKLMKNWELGVACHQIVGLLFIATNKSSVTDSTKQRHLTNCLTGDTNFKSVSINYL